MQDGISVADLGERCSLKKIRGVIKALGWFCGRYKLDRRPEHSTETSVVYLATKFMADNPRGQRVAIKFMSDKDQYERETQVRKSLDPRLT